MCYGINSLFKKRPFNWERKYFYPDAALYVKQMHKCIIYEKIYKLERQIWILFQMFHRKLVSEIWIATSWYQYITYSRNWIFTRNQIVLCDNVKRNASEKRNVDIENVTPKSQQKLKYVLKGMKYWVYLLVCKKSIIFLIWYILGDVI